ncbi:MAG: CoxG family protein [Acidobacteriota bacterium]
MRLDGRVHIKAPRERVWKFLTDADAISKCMPGVDSIEVVTPDKKFRATGSVGLGSVKVKFSNDVEWTELDPPKSAKMKIHGTSPGSSLDMTSVMSLADGPGGSTDMNWSADVKVLGTLASLAARLMKPVTQKLAGEFFNCVKKKIEK